MTELRTQHITKEVFDNWQQGKLEGSQETEFLNHVGTCTFCAGKFADWMEEGLLEEPPAYLKEEITERTGQIDVQTSKQIRLIVYSLKVGLAVAASIFLLTLTTGLQNMNLEVPKRQQNRTESGRESVTVKLREGSNYIADTLNRLADGLVLPERKESNQ